MEKELSARERQAIQTREKLLKAGKEIFLENGFQKATISQIIKRANTGYGTAYVYFKNKDDLLIVLMEEVMEKFYQVAERSYQPGTKQEARQLISEQVRLFLICAVEEEAMMKVVKEAIGSSPEIESKWNSIRERFIERISVDIQYVQDNGLAAPTFKPKLVARGWFYANEMFMWDYVKGENDYVMEDVITHLTNLYMDGLYV